MLIEAHFCGGECECFDSLLALELLKKKKKKIGEEDGEEGKMSCF